MTQRLVAIAVEHWRDIDGYAVAHNMPELGSMPLGRMCNFVWWWMTRNADQKERDKLERRLYMPPKGVQPTAGPWSAEAETEAFGALRQGLRT